jgi:hypothetical protein
MCFLYVRVALSNSLHAFISSSSLLNIYCLFCCVFCYSKLCEYHALIVFDFVLILVLRVSLVQEVIESVFIFIFLYICVLLFVSPFLK